MIAYVVEEEELDKIATCSVLFCLRTERSVNHLPICHLGTCVESHLKNSNNDFNYESVYVRVTSRLVAASLAQRGIKRTHFAGRKSRLGTCRQAGSRGET
jgi:hypothetical protein